MGLAPPLKPTRATPPWFFLVSLLLLPVFGLAAPHPDDKQDNCPALYKTVGMDVEYRGEELRGVEYFSAAKRARSQLRFQSGKLIDQQGKPLHGSGIWVMDEQGAFYFTQEDKLGKVHHFSLLGGMPVAAAGTFRANHGKLTLLTDYSGHYRPRAGHLVQAIRALQGKGVSLDQTELRSFQQENKKLLKVAGIGLGAGAGIGGAIVGPQVYSAQKEKELEDLERSGSLGPTQPRIQHWIKSVSPSGTSSPEHADRLAREWAEQKLTWTQFDELRDYQEKLGFYLGQEDALNKAQEYVLSRRVTPDQFATLMERYSKLQNGSSDLRALNRAEAEVLKSGDELPLPPPRP